MSVMGSFCYELMNKIVHYLLANLLTSSVVPSELDQWFKHTLCVSYFTEIISGPFGNVPVNKIRHYVLAIIPGLLGGHYITNQWIKL